jgi:hypothetical protein
MAARRGVHWLKSTGYLISIASVLLLGAVAWGGTDGSPRLRLCLIAGMAASIIGMLCRWTSYIQDERTASRSSS